MSVSIQLQFADFDAAAAFFASKTNISGPSPTEIVAAPVAASPAPVAAVEKPKGGKKAKAPETAAPAATVPPLDVKNGDPLPPSMQPPATSAVDPLEVPEFLVRKAETPAKVYTIEEVREELKKVSEKHGIDAIRAIVVEVGGTSRISEVPAEKYAAVVEAAQKKLSG